MATGDDIDVVNIEAPRNDSFVLVRDVSDFADLYPLADCSFRAQLRDSVDHPLVYEELSTANGLITYDAVPAEGAFYFDVQPVADTKITVGLTDVVFKTSGATGNQVNIGGSLPVTLASLLTLLQGSTGVDLAKCTYSLDGSRLNAVYKVAGHEGNTFAISTNVARASTSGPTLEGGAHLLLLEIPIEVTRRLDTPKYYSVQLHYDDAYQTLFEGTITLRQTATR